jgi:hypothetical protein
LSKDSPRVYPKTTLLGERDAQFTFAYAWQVRTQDIIRVCETGPGSPRRYEDVEENVLENENTHPGVGRQASKWKAYLILII